MASVADDFLTARRINVFPDAVYSIFKFPERNYFFFSLVYGKKTAF